MNIKSLLLGSAAAMAAVTGAQAADAIVIAEPEPLEYVRICDVYGAGYFYIPGTETCLRIHGRVRYEIRGSSVTDAWSKYTEARLEATAKNETDYGTLTSYIRYDLTRTDGAAGQGAKAYFNLAGFEVGFFDSQWARFLGYGGFTDAGGSYGFHNRHYISYSFAADGFSGYVSLDHDTNNNYTPDISAGVKGTFGNFGAGVQAGWDESTDEFAVAGYLTTTFDPVSLKLIALYASGANSYWSDSEWSVIVGANASLTDKLSAAVDFQWWDDTGVNDWAVIGALVYDIAPGLQTRLELTYTDVAVGSSTTTGFLRFDRTF